ADVLAAVTSPKIFIVPVLVSNGVFTDEILPQKLGGLRQGRQIVVCEPVGSHPDMAQIILSQARTAMKNDKIDFQQTSLLLVAHGSEKNAQAAIVAREQAERIRALKGFGECRALFMAQEPLVRDWAQRAALPNVVVVPFFMANGKHVREDIPALLGIPAGLLNRSFKTQNKHLWVAEPVVASPMLLNVILDRIKSA
ncbi:MAG: CbiX/SirB N-terminal domain-containing protein, partial [bacterium]